MAYGSAVTQDIPKGEPPGYVGDSRDRARLVAAHDQMVAARPLKPPPLHISEARVSPAQIEARKDARRSAAATFAQLPESPPTVEAPELPPKPEIAIALRASRLAPG